ncbi:MAG: DUF1579 family protein [Alphaproteobacteria bacterium]|nr:DUF1579 family protein [Alphaproteobacteria bacterium]
MNAPLLVALLSACSLAATPAVAEPSIKDLDALTGTWEFYDEATELAGFEYREEGTQTCRYALDDSFIRCDGTGTARGKTRHFTMYINYNRFKGTFEMVGLFGNFPEKSFFTIKPSEDLTKLELFGRRMNQRDGSTTQNYGVITFTDANSFTWETRVNKSTEPLNHWPLRFTGEYNKVAD